MKQNEADKGNSEADKGNSEADKGNIEAEVKQALQVIIDNRDSKALSYAVNYAIAGLHMAGEALKVQVLYVLNNMAYWRGVEAKHCRQVLKSFK